MKDKDITDVADLQSVLKEMLKSGVEILLEAELDDEVAYDRYDRNNDKTITEIASLLSVLELTH